MAKIRHCIPASIRVPEREPWHYLFELNDIADAIDEEFIDKPLVELMEAICDCEQHPIVRALSSRLHRRFNKLFHVEAICTSTIRELSLGTLRNMGLGHAAEDIDTRLTTLTDRLDEWESCWRDTIWHNGYSVRSRQRTDPTYPPGPAAYLGDDADKAMHQLTEVDEYAAVTVATIRQLVNERKATIPSAENKPSTPATDETQWSDHRRVSGWIDVLKKLGEVISEDTFRRRRKGEAKPSYRVNPESSRTSISLWIPDLPANYSDKMTD